MCVSGRCIGRGRSSRHLRLRRHCGIASSCSAGYTALSLETRGAGPTPPCQHSQGNHSTIRFVHAHSIACRVQGSTSVRHQPLAERRTGSHSSSSGRQEREAQLQAEGAAERAPRRPAPARGGHHRAAERRKVSPLQPGSSSGRTPWCHLPLPIPLLLTLTALPLGCSPSCALPSSQSTKHQAMRCSVPRTGASRIGGSTCAVH